MAGMGLFWLIGKVILFAKFPRILFDEVGEFRHTKNLFFSEAHSSRALRSLITSGITCDSRPDQRELERWAADAKQSP